MRCLGVWHKVTFKVWVCMEHDDPTDGLVRLEIATSARVFRFVWWDH